MIENYFRQALFLTVLPYTFH